MVGQLTAVAILIAQAKKKAAKKAQKATQKKGQAASIIRIKHPTHPASITSVSVTFLVNPTYSFN